MAPDSNIKTHDDPKTPPDRFPAQKDTELVLEMAKAASDCPGNVDPNLVFKALVQVVFGSINWG